MKIIKLSGIAVIFSLFALCFSSCKSTKVSDKAPSQKEAAAETESAGNADAAAAGEEASENGMPVQAPARKEIENWVEARKPIPVSNGLVVLRYKKRVGSFNIAVRNSEDKLIPVFSTANEFTSSAFYLKSNNKIIKLINDGTVKPGYSLSEHGLRISYNVPGTAEVLLEFMIFPSEERGQSDMVKVTATVTNKTTQTRELALKAVLDTILGETNDFHFYTGAGVPVKHEVLYKKMENEKGIISRNPNAAVQMFFFGADCTAPEAVALGNYSTFNKNEWLPNMYSYRQFDSVFAYNNSAVEVVWPTFKLNPDESGKCIFYLAFGTDTEKLRGENYIYPPKEESEEDVEDVEDVEEDDVVEAPSEPVAEVVPVQVEEVSAKEEKVEVQPQTEEEGEKEVVLPKKKSSKKKKTTINPNKFTDQQLTPEYVQSLLDRIIALEEDDPSLNRAEIFQLNAELDAILEVLGL